MTAWTLTKISLRAVRTHLRRKEMVCKMWCYLLKLQLDATTWAFPAAPVLPGASRAGIRKGDPYWGPVKGDTEAFLCPLWCILVCTAMEMCSDLDRWAGIAQGTARESPGLQLTRCKRTGEDIPVAWPNHCFSCLLGSGYVFFFGA